MKNPWPAFLSGFAGYDSTKNDEVSHFSRTDDNIRPAQEWNTLSACAPTTVQSVVTGSHSYQIIFSFS